MDASDSDQQAQPRPFGQALALYFCFFFSGIAGLIYEVVWSRYLALFLGSTGEAHIIILSTYMGGLAVGAALFGRVADRSPNPLKLYAMLELGIGVVGAVYPVLFEPVRGLFISVVKSMGLTPAALNVAAIIACSITLLLPTALMGGTLPALGRHLIRSEASLGRRIASLYYLNSFGAVIGSLLGGFWLVRTLGLEATMYSAAFLNVAVGVVALGLSKMEEAREEESEPAPLAAPPDDPAAARIARVALIVIALSGFASMVYEVAWIRLLTLVLGSSNFSFALMLSAFIFGITLGSFILSLKKEDGGYAAILGWSELAIGLTALVMIVFYQRLPIVLNHLRTGLVRDEHTYPAFQALQFALCFAVMVLPTIFMGATVPAASRVVAAGFRSVGRKIGNVFAVNTIGTLFGSLAAGFILLPRIGIKHTVELAVALNVALGLWTLAANPERARRPSLRMPLALALALAVPAIYKIAAPDWDVRVFSAATYRTSKRIESFRAFKEKLAEREILYYRDGTDASIAVSRDPNPRIGQVTALLINGKADASNDEDMITQLLLGHVPMLLHPSPKRALVVGMGAGVSAGATTLYDAERTDCVELIPEVVEAADFFKQYNQDINHNPRARVIVQDAKTFLQVTPEKYDVIMNQPTNLWITGVASLFTTEYLEMCRARMNKGGFFVQWIQTYEVLDETLYSITNTFHEVFPYSTIFNFSAYDVALIGSTEPFEPDFARIERFLAKPEIASGLGPFGMNGIFPLLSMQMIAKNRTPAPYIDPGAVGGLNSDFFPTLEYEAARGFYMGSRSKALQYMDQRSWSPARSALWIHRYRPKEIPPESVFEEYFHTLGRMSSLYAEQPAAWCDLWQQYYPDSPRAQLARARLKLDRFEGRVAALETASLRADPEALALKARLLTQRHEIERSWARLPDDAAARAALEQLAQALPSERPFAYAALGDLERDAARPDVAIMLYKRALDQFRPGALLSPEGPSADEIQMRVAEASLDLLKPDDAAEALGKIANVASLPGALGLRYHLLKARIGQARQALPAP